MNSTTRRTFIQTAAIASASPMIIAAEPRSSAKERRVIETDVLVCGGGCAGSAAALAAARSGAKTLLVEKAPFAGGIITSVGLPYFDGIAHIDTKRILVRGIALEMLSKSGVCAPDAQTVTKHNPTIPNTFEFKLLLDRLFQEQKDHLRLLFNSFVCDAQRNGDRIESVTIANKDGLVTVKPKVVIDCSGDADVAAWSGVPFEQNSEVQPLTLHFRIGNVKPISPTEIQACKDALKAAQAAGELPHYYGPGIMFLFHGSEVYIHGVRVHANAVNIDLATVKEEHDAGAVVVRQLASGLCGFERVFAGLYFGGRDGLHVANAEMQRERLHFAVLLKRHAGPGGHIGIAGAINDDFGLHSYESVLVSDGDAFDAVAVALGVANEAVEEQPEMVLLFLEKPVEQKLELEGIWNRRIVLCYRLGVWSTHAGF